MFDILPIPAVVAVLLIAGLAIPYFMPRVGAVTGAIAVVVGALIFAGHSNDPFWHDLFDDLTRALGTYTMTYGAIWIGLGALRHHNQHQVAEPA